MQNDVREVLEGASHSIYGREPDKVHVSEWNAWRDREIRFRRFLDAEAYLDAAMMLVPVGWSFSLGEMMGLPLDSRWRCHLRDHREPYNPATCAWSDCDKSHPAIAIATAALKAKEQP